MTVRMLFATAVVTATAALAACGSDDSPSGASGDGGSSGDASAVVEQAREFVERAKQPRTPEDSELPAESPPAEQGASLISVVCSASIEGCRAISDAQVEAARAIGWSARVVDGEGSPKGWNDAIQAAIQAQPDVIALAAILPSAVSGALEQARSEGIVVVCTQCGAPAGRDGVQASDGDDINPTIGTYMGNYVLAEGGDEANVLMMYYPEFAISKVRHDAAEEVLAQCDSCTTETIEVKISEWGTTLPGRIQTLLQQNPDVGWIYSPADETAIDSVNAVQAAGRADDVKVVGGNGNLQAFETIQQDPTYAATAAVSYAFSSWASIDNANRLLNGQQPVQTKSPVRLIDQSNIGSLTPGEYYSGDIDFRSTFRELWSVR